MELTLNQLCVHTHTHALTHTRTHSHTQAHTHVLVLFFCSLVVYLYFSQNQNEIANQSTALQPSPKQYMQHNVKLYRCTTYYNTAARSLNTHNNIILMTALLEYIVNSS